MDNNLITLAIHTNLKAQILKQVLLDNGIRVVLEDISTPDSSRFSVKINESDLNKALMVAEANNLFNYTNAQTHKIDDGKRRILVAVDFSSYSFKACQIAFNIAAAIDAKVKILHVLHNVYFPSTIPFADTVRGDKSNEQLNKIRKQMLDLCCEIDKRISDGEFPSVNYSYSIRESISVEEGIDTFIEEYMPSLLVLGTKGKDASNSKVLGNVTADIIETTSVPIIAVPENSPINSLKDIHHIAFLTNFQERDLYSFDFLVNTLKPFSEVKITLVHLNLINKKGDRWPETELHGMKEYFEKNYPQVNVGYKLIDTPDMIEAINNFLTGEKVNIVCLNTQKRNLFGRMFVPSVSRKVLLNTSSDVALLILRG
ncbi:universal stress protein [Dysgonomonas sp. 216]|uniref:universal stress protein n=1 Tax=Dysgonomonas sp. 216 TaxID=2302934 RepID=UPI0013D268C4|nr:universal stress protein [Dysgonomonas sp. 216]NDW17599.1 universal stress protein [Dysgonomonas sp. 216]